MAYTKPTDDICFQEGSGWFSMTAGADLVAGQALTVDDTFAAIVCPAANEAGFIGVAGYDADDGDKVLVYGPGNIIRSHCISDTAVGAAVTNEVDQGGFGDASVSVKQGVALEAGTSGSSFRILLV